jgi:hypothetical protein
MSAAAIAHKAPARNGRGSCHRGSSCAGRFVQIRKTYQSTFSIVSSEISPTAWFSRCIVTYVSITRPEMSRSRRIIEELAKVVPGA